MPLISKGFQMAITAKPNDFPLGERFRKAEYLARELSEHLRQAYLPKLAALRVASKVYDPEEVSDQEMLDHMLAVLQADDFTSEVYEQLDAFLQSIRDEMSSLLYGGKAPDPSTAPAPDEESR